MIKLTGKTIKKIKVSQFQLDILSKIIKKYFVSENGYVFYENEKHNTGYIVQSFMITYRDIAGNITAYYADIM